MEKLTSEQIQAGLALGRRIEEAKEAGKVSAAALRKILAAADPKDCGGFVGEALQPVAPGFLPSVASRRSANIAAGDGNWDSMIRRRLWEWGATPWIESILVEENAALTRLHLVDFSDQWEMGRFIYGARMGESALELGKAAWRGAPNPRALLKSEESCLSELLGRMSPGEAFHGARDKKGLEASRLALAVRDERSARLSGQDMAKAEKMLKRCEAAIRAKSEAAERKGSEAKISEEALLRARSLAALCLGSPRDAKGFEALLAASAEVLADPRALTRVPKSSRSALEAAIEKGALSQATMMLKAGADPWEAAASRRGNPVIWAALNLRFASMEIQEAGAEEAFEEAFAKACMDKAARVWKERAKEKCLEAGRAALLELGHDPETQSRCQRICAKLEATRVEEALGPEAPAAPSGAKRRL